MASKKTSTKKKASNRTPGPKGVPDYPRHPLSKSLRVPRAILEQNAGRACSGPEAAAFCGVGNHGPFKSEVGSSVKFGFLSRPGSGTVEVTELAKRALRPQSDTDEVDALRTAVLNAPVISDVYKHYRGENLPDDQFFNNALTDTFKIPIEKREEFRAIFLESLRDAKLIDQHGDKARILDISTDPNVPGASKQAPKLGHAAAPRAGETCFVMMPFAPPIGDYFKSVYAPAIENAGLKAIRADDDMFSTGKIMDQIWSGISSARILVAELTGRNPNVFYELGLAHALRKPVVLVSSTEADVPFDVQHIRVIYYDVRDPFWGQKLVTKLTENITSAMKNPEEAILPQPYPIMP